ncbi:alpha/beta hydrolase [Pedobacter glucosidilyticus]|uniref:alpha/beta hydrolase n=1 Tax=Pedobacter glucosidilyticus TaxID=1122941 RepID=UPI000404AEAA|nr:alpha/beta hydrolase [Pedobacter glucosidilyticus]
MIKHKWLFILTTVLSQLICSLTFAQNSNPVGYQPPSPSEIKLPNNITLHQNLRYAPIPQIATDSTSDRILDLYLPTNNSSTSLPVFVFIHGGGFTGGDKRLVDLCSKIASQGFAVASINYRLTLKYKKVSGASCSANMAKGLPVNGAFHPVLNEAIKNASDDAISALQWIKDNAVKYNLNTGKVAIGGGSAGGMTALHAAYASQQKVLPIIAVVNLWGGLENANVISKISPPLLTYHGDLDTTINIEYAYALKERMDKIGSDKSQLKILKDKGHAQYNLIAKEKINEITSFLNSFL